MNYDVMNGKIQNDDIYDNSRNKQFASDSYFVNDA